eukprot:m.376136 g.376136  ORF g.376136 m.376136 type:complete len:56 (+) comp16700_c0_seq33:4499-4666(+)
MNAIDSTPAFSVDITGAVIATGSGDLCDLRPVVMCDRLNDTNQERLRYCLVGRVH